MAFIGADAPENGCHTDVAGGDKVDCLLVHMTTLQESMDASITGLREDFRKVSDEIAANNLRMTAFLERMMKQNDGEEDAAATAGVVNAGGLPAMENAEGVEDISDAAGFVDGEVLADLDNAGIGHVVEIGGKYEIQRVPCLCGE